MHSSISAAVELHIYTSSQ